MERVIILKTLAASIALGATLGIIYHKRKIKKNKPEI